MIQRWKKSVEAAGLNVSREIAFAIVLGTMSVLVTALLYLFLGPSFYLILPVMAGMMAVYFYLGRFRRVLDRKDREMTLEFVRLFTFFGVYVQDGFNVYSALKEITGFASEEMKGRLEKLSSGIEEDKSVEPFIEFANAFKDISIKQVMLSIYQMVDDGQGGVYVRQFERLFGQLSEQKHRMKVEKWHERLKTLSSLPLMGSGIAIIALSLSLTSIMEGSLYVV